MARPLPDLKEAARRGAIVARHVAALGGLKPTERALIAADCPLRYETLRDYIRAVRVAPDDVMAALEALVGNRPKWLRQKIDGQIWIVHLYQPPFAACFVDGEPTAVQWFTGAPAARQHGQLIKAAQEYLAGK